MVSIRFLFCLSNFVAVKAEEPECRIDSDCPSKLACINSACQNPCIVNNPCSRQQECVVKDTRPSKSVACLCPDGHITDQSGACSKVEAVPECYVDADCDQTDVCDQGNCVEACKLAECGVNAICKNSFHSHQCVCPDGFLGNPDTSCYPCKTRDCWYKHNCLKKHLHDAFCVSVVPQTEPTLAAGCANNDECPDHTACKNRLCINPCAYDDPCASNANCRVVNHEPVCSCPDGFIGDPKIRCELRMLFTFLCMLFAEYFLSDVICMIVFILLQLHQRLNQNVELTQIVLLTLHA